MLTLLAPFFNKFSCASSTPQPSLNLKSLAFPEFILKISSGLKKLITCFDYFGLHSIAAVIRNGQIWCRIEEFL